MATRRRKTPIPDTKTAAERFLFLDKVVGSFSGQLDDLESALGMYVIGHYYGWKILYLIHSKKTIRKYESILGIKISEVFPDFGKDADQTNAFKLIEGISSFWKVVSGDEKVDMDRDTRRSTI